MQPRHMSPLLPPRDGRRRGGGDEGGRLTMRAWRTSLAGLLTLTLVLPAKSAAAQDIADRDAVVAEIGARWEGSAADGGRELRAALARLGPDRLLSAQAAKTPAELNAAVLNLGGVDPQAGLGDPRTHLVFFPVTP